MDLQWFIKYNEWEWESTNECASANNYLMFLISRLNILFGQTAKRQWSEWE